MGLFDSPDPAESAPSHPALMSSPVEADLA